MQIAGHYAIVVDDKQRKGEIKCIILTALRECKAVFPVRESLCRTWRCQARHCPCRCLYQVQS